jgi:hypothetical protein
MNYIDQLYSLPTQNHIQVANKPLENVAKQITIASTKNLKSRLNIWGIQVLFAPHQNSLNGTNRRKG